MSRFRTTAATAALLLALPLSVVAASPAPAAPAGASAPSSPTYERIELPRPTGPFAIGQEILHLVDTARTDPWVPSSGPRQLMVSMYYPAHAGTGTPAPYMTPGAARALLDGKVAGNHIPTEVVAGARTWSETGARPFGGHYPLIVLSPGFTAPRTELTGLAEELTSHGYVVALVDHTYENTGTTLPDGRTLPCVACGNIDGDAGFRALEEGRTKDVSFVLDQLTDRPHPAWRYSRLIDRDRIGMAGHSAGGAAAIPVMLTDDRIKAGANLDGAFGYRVPEGGIGDKPFLMISHTQPDGSESDTWKEAWARLDGWKRWLLFDGADHGSFTDLPVFMEKLGIPRSPGTTMSARRGVDLTRQYVVAFFDQQLKGVDQPLLDGPSAANPEVRFHS